mmetsp:Transcript_19193/g.36119  ORF Transcript_19193/g.36119 Transcript_19193/m.36119 type:complete len:119 (+) Transcript_19193:378-734(+)
MEKQGKNQAVLDRPQQTLIGGTRNDKELVRMARRPNPMERRVFLQAHKQEEQASCTKTRSAQFYPSLGPFLKTSLAAFRSKQMVPFHYNPFILLSLREVKKRARKASLPPAAETSRTL